MTGVRSIIIDIYAKDSLEKIYDIEVQRAASEADVHRVRIIEMLLKGKANYPERAKNFS